MYLTVIAWIYVVLMMSIAEATSTTGTVLGAVMTFLLYGVLPLSIVMYLLGTPSRRKARKAQEGVEHTQTEAAHATGASSAPAATDQASGQPDAGSHAAGTADAQGIHAAATAVREKP